MRRQLLQLRVDIARESPGVNHLWTRSAHSMAAVTSSLEDEPLEENAVSVRRHGEVVHCATHRFLLADESPSATNTTLQTNDGTPTLLAHVSFRGSSVPSQDRPRRRPATFNVPVGSTLHHADGFSASTSSSSGETASVTQQRLAHITHHSPQVLVISQYPTPTPQHSRFRNINAFHNAAGVAAPLGIIGGGSSPQAEDGESLHFPIGTGMSGRRETASAASECGQPDVWCLSESTWQWNGKVSLSGSGEAREMSPPLYFSENESFHPVMCSGENNVESS